MPSLARRPVPAHDLSPSFGDFITVPVPASPYKTNPENMERFFGNKSFHPLQRTARPYSDPTAFESSTIELPIPETTNPELPIFTSMTSTTIDEPGTFHYNNWEPSAVERALTIPRTPPEIPAPTIAPRSSRPFLRVRTSSEKSFQATPEDRPLEQQTTKKTAGNKFRKLGNVVKEAAAGARSRLSSEEKPRGSEERSRTSHEGSNNSVYFAAGNGISRVSLFSGRASTATGEASSDKRGSKERPSSDEDWKETYGSTNEYRRRHDEHQKKVGSLRAKLAATAAWRIEVDKQLMEMQAQLRDEEEAVVACREGFDSGVRKLMRGGRLVSMELAPRKELSPVESLSKLCPEPHPALPL